MATSGRVPDFAALNPGYGTTPLHMIATAPRHSFVNRGGRFSMKAAMPSLRSLVANKA